MGSLLREKLAEVLKSVVPLVAAVSLLQFLLVHAPLPLFLQFLGGATLATIGMLLLFIGIERGILPMGRYIGAELPRRGSVALIVGVVFGVGFVTTVAEPDVLVLAQQFTAVSQSVISEFALIYIIGLGMAAFAAVAILRVVTGWPMSHMLAVAFVLVVAIALAAPAAFVPLAFDAGSVTTGVLSAPVMIALALGLSSVLAGRSAVADGFGLLGFASLGPILVVLIAGLLQK